MEVGRTLGSYHVVAPLGTGGMGVVFRARDTRLKREVALKFLPEQLAQDRALHARLEREAQVLAALNHPNIATIHSVEEAEGVPFLVLELVEGETLQRRLAGGRLPAEEVVSIARQVAEALEAAHGKGIVHRDLKPSNVAITPEGRVKVLDFGLAKALRLGDGADDVTLSATEAAELTAPGTLVGTVPYMSPEQIRGEAVDERSDIWSLGCVLFEALSGRRAFQRATMADTVAAVIEREPDWDALPRETPHDLRLLLERCLDKDPDRRPQQARELRREIDTIAGSAARAAPATRLPVDRRRRRAELLAGVLLAGVFVAVATLRPEWLGGRAREPAAPKIHSIAVLPFADMSADADREYFSDGMTEELISALRGVSGLRVASRAAAFANKGRDADLRSVASRLGVEWVLTGSVRYSGDRVRIAAELIGGSDGFPLWSQSFEREMQDVFEVQDAISQAIVNALKIELQAGESPPQVKRYTDNLQAYHAYWRGRYFWNKRDPQSVGTAMQHFREALQLDPAYAPAYSGLADCWTQIGSYALMPPHEVFPQGEQAALRALELDPSLAEAHTSLGLIRLFYHWDRPAAREAFARAIDLDPKNAMPIVGRSLYYLSVGREDDAIAAARRAVEVDPLMVTTSGNLGRALYFSRRYDEAIEQLEATLAMDPSYFRAYGYLGVAYQEKGMFEEAFAALQRAGELTGGHPLVVGALGRAYAAAGREEQAREILAQLTARSEQGFVSSLFVALVHIGLGENDRAFELLEQAVDERATMLIHLDTDPFFDSLRGDPRFDEIRRRVALR